ncbi:hypothetical protein D9M72_546370 [compost metagenome]
MAEPVPATQVVPPSVLYSQVAPASMPVTLMVPSLVMPSVAESPVSLARTGVGLTGALTAPESMVICPRAVGAPAVLPARSVCCTRIWPSA